MDCEIGERELHSLTSSWPEIRGRLDWGSVFVLPWWLEVWWQNFGAGSELLLFDVSQGGEVIGIAPLAMRQGTASFIGSSDVCDYMDFIVAPGEEQAFFNALLDGLGRRGIRELQLESLRSDSRVLTSLADIAVDRGCEVSLVKKDVSLELDLPSSWDEYLDVLSTKQRRESGRKLRRLYEEGNVEFATVEDSASVQQAMDVFLRQLRDSRRDKAAFMTERMESFFRSIADAMAGAGLLRVGILRINEAPVASVMCFDYNGVVYLYNSGYDPLYGYLGAGLLSKLLSIRDSIERGRKRYDFLKGAEEYKYRLGGREIPIYSCRIATG